MEHHNYRFGFTLAEVFHPAEQLRKNAFTLAEVLITLGIIGVIAALTLPVLVQKYQERVLTTSFLRVYSILGNAYLRVQQDLGTFENWSDGKINVFENGNKTATDADPMKVYNIMIKPYVKVNKSYLKNGEINCMPEDSYDLYGENQGNMSRKAPAVSLVSGECILLNNSFGPGEFIVDLNGKKGPNTFGKDQFHMAFNPYKPEKLKPDWTNNVSYCDRTSPSSWIAGLSCGYWILSYHNMDYLHISFDELKKRWKGIDFQF